jgi:hypothetical protein
MVHFPVSFNVNGTDFKFIVISSPQFINWPTSSDVNAVIDYATSHYGVNKNRIYLTGLSMGGGAVWNMPGRIQLMVRNLLQLFRLWRILA